MKTKFLNRPKILVVVGPTAVGKTALGIKLAQEFNGEIISGDSLQVYRDLDIGTAKATIEEQQQAPHHLLDIRNWNEHYSAYDFKIEAGQVITQLQNREKLSIVVGGTGLYLQALLADFSLGGEQKNHNLRKKYEALSSECGSEFLWQLLMKKDPKAGTKIPPTNQRRIIRALEVIELTGASITDFDADKNVPYDYFLLGLNTDRAILYQRINTRVDLMLEAGLLDEVKMLFDFSLTQGSLPQAVQGIGYKEFFPYFQGQINLAEAITQVKRNSRHFAKRQLTWFRNRFNQVHWFDLVNDQRSYDLLLNEVKLWLNS